MKAKHKIKTKKEIRTLWRYGVGSTISYLINVAIIMVMTEQLGIHYLLSSIAGYVSIIITSYIFSVKWIFTERKIASRRKEFTAFTLITIFAMCMNLFSMWMFTEKFHLHYIVSNVVTNFMATLWGYVPKKLFLFSERKKPVEEYELEDIIPSFEDVDELPIPFIYEDELEDDEQEDVQTTLTK